MLKHTKCTFIICKQPLRCNTLDISGGREELRPGVRLQLISRSALVWSDCSIPGEQLTVLGISPTLQQLHLYTKLMKSLPLSSSTVPPPKALCGSVSGFAWIHPSVLTPFWDVYESVSDMLNDIVQVNTALI